MNAPKKPLQVLLVEDEPEDARLILRELSVGGFAVTHQRVTNAAELQAALTNPAWELVLCDFSLPHFSGERALHMIRETGCEAPVIFVSGTIGEETAVNAMRLGAQDYVMKDKLARLAPAVERELREAVIRRQAKQADLNLRQSEHKYRHLFESLQDAAFLLAETNGVVIDTNVAAERLLGSPRHDILGRRFGDYGSPPLSPERLKAPAGQSPEFEIEVVRVDGRRVPVRISIAPVELHDRPFVLALVHDLTAQRVAQAALRASEQRFSRVFNFSPTGICIIRASDGRFVDVNDAFLKMLGYPREEIIGRTSSELELWSNPEDRAETVATLRERGAIGSHRINGRKRNGDPVVGLAASSVMTLNGEDHFLSLIHDMTDLQKAEEARRESEERFRQVTDNIGEVFWLTDADKSAVIYVSPAYASIWGRSCESLYANPLSWLDSVLEADRERVQAAMADQHRAIYDLEYRIRRADGTVRWIHDRAFPVHDSAGRVYRIAGIAEDVTARRQLEEQLRQAQKMEAIGQLAGGIAHDFNNLLTIVTMQCSLLMPELKDPSASAGLQQVLDAATRGVALTRQLLTFSRRGLQEDFRSIDLASQLGAMAKLLHRILGEQIEVQTRFAPGVPNVLADPGKMEQVLMNLVINARDAMPDGGRLIVGIDLAEIGPEHLSTHATARLGRFVRLTVTDSGCGIPADILPRVFEPFFTTKEVGKGTGLGLATVFGIVQQHQGWVEVDSTVGTGTEFRVYLPPAKTSSVAGKNVSERRASAGTETILLVEDEDVVRALAAEALRRDGYRVVQARSGAEALQQAQTPSFGIDLLITDLVMPGGMSGQALATELQSRNPRLKVIYSTGYPGEIIGKLPVRSGWNYLPKPYSLQDLGTIVRRRLDEAAPPDSVEFVSLSS